MARPLVLFAVMAGCACSEPMTTSDATPADAARSDAPGLDAPGLDAPGLDAPGLDAPGLDAPPGPLACGDEPPAFPGAEGFGACARGGRGGRVIHVTTLAAGGTGSLQAALDETGPRTIVFDVSGVVAGVPIVTNGEVTIAGQTSPAGVVLRGLLVQGDEVCEAEDCPLPAVSPRDVIVRHLRLRPSGMGDDGLRLHHARDVIVDHVSIGNAIDEAAQISFSSDVTIQHTILAETLTTDHDVIYGGILVNYSDPARGWPNTRLTFHHDLLVRLAGRLPELSRENHDGDHGVLAEIELRSNVVWDPRRPITAATVSDRGGEVGWRIDLVDTYFRVAPGHPHAMFVMEPAPTLSGTRVHLDGNVLSRFPMLGGWALANSCDCNDYGDGAASGVVPFTSPPAYASATPTLSPPVAVTRTTSGPALATELAASAGCLPHDTMDRRLTAMVSGNVIDPAPPDTNPASDALVLDDPTPPAAPPDGDGDGMPDAWETAAGLSPTSDDGAIVGPLSALRLGTPGYTNLEVYLAERAAEL